MAGRSVTVEEVLAELEKDEIYYRNSDGGVTFSGGEPLLQQDFVRELARGSRQRGYHTAIDTAGNVPWAAFEAVLPHTDLFLFDVKAFDERKHKRATGSSNQRVLDNLKRLANAEVPITIRIPVIPGVNDDLAEMEAIAWLLKDLRHIDLIELLPFHHLGASKYQSLGKPYRSKGIRPPSSELLDRLVEVFTSKGLNAQRP
jgi:pyruvate formate lyase activating enzyme